MLRITLALISLIGFWQVNIAQLKFEPTPVKYPAKIAWGTFMYSEQLFDNPANWKFVRDNIDVYLMHQQYWLNTNYLVYCKGPTAGKNRWAEFAAIIGNKPVSLENAVYFHAWGVPTAADSDVGKIWAQRIMTDQVTPLRNAGINLTEVNIDMGPKAALGGIARRHPDWSEVDLTALYGCGTAGGYTGSKPVGNGIWKTFTEELNKQNPVVSANIVAAHVFFDWKEPGKTPLTSISSHLVFNPLMDQAGTSPVLVNGQPVSKTFDGYQWFTSHFKGGNSAINTNFVSDTPYEYWNWSNTTVRDDYRKIIKTYEEWLHANGREHHLIVTGGAQGTENPLDGQPDDAYCNASQTVRDQLDLVYYNKSMLGIQLYQRLGMRPDMFVVESWLKYPYDVANENKPGSFAKLGKDIINYLKGPNLKLDLKMVLPTAGFGTNIFESNPQQQRSADQLPALGAQKTYEFAINNSTGVTILPMVKFQQLKMVGTTIQVFDGNTDITAAIQSADGYTYPNQCISPTSTIKVVVSNISKALDSEGGFSLFLYWNPQDSSECRDAMAVTYNENSLVTYWDFITTTEGWIRPNNMTITAANSIATMTITATDPNVTSPANLNLLASDYKFITIRLQNLTSANTAEIFWTTDAEPNFDGAKRVGFTVIPNDTIQRYYVVPLSGALKWTGTLKQLRLDPTTAATGKVLVDFVKLTGFYPAVLAVIPGMIEAEDFNTGGQGNGYADSDSQNRGGKYRISEGVDISLLPNSTTKYTVGWVNSGEWLEYVVDVAKTAKYDVDFRVSSIDGSGRFFLQLDGFNITNPVVAAVTGSYSTYQSQSTTTTMMLPAGKHLLRFVADKAGFNVDNFTFQESNLAPTNIFLSASSISENKVLGSLIGTLSSADQDANNSFTYSLPTGVSDNSSFTIVGNELKSNAVFNFEAKNSYSIKVRTTDQGGLFFEKTFTILINDVNDTPKITKFQLIKGGTSNPIIGYDPMSDGAVIDLSKLSETQFNMFAIPSYGADSLVFQYNLNGEIGKQKDVLAPFALKGDGVNYKSWQLTPGNYSITANLYLLGAKTDTRTIAFSVKDVTTSFASNNGSDGFRIYPNPANAFVTIEDISMQEVPYSVSLYNVVSEKMFEKAACLNKQSIDVSTYLPGVYSICVSTPTQMFSYKIIIIR